MSHWKLYFIAETEKNPKVNRKSSYGSRTIKFSCFIKDFMTSGVLSKKLVLG